jgi:hypothetical protein
MDSRKRIVFLAHDNKKPDGYREGSEKSAFA